MSCISQALSSIDSRCDVSVGGIKEILIGNFDDVNNVEISTSNNPFQYITDIDMKIGTKMEKWQFRVNTGSYTSTFSSDPAIGNNIVTTELNLQFSRSESVKRKVIQDALGNANVIIIKDMYGNYIYLGKDEEVSVTNTVMQSGTSKSDLSGFTITFSYESEEMPHYISPDFDVDSLLVVKRKQVYQFDLTGNNLYNVQGGHYYDTENTETVNIDGNQEDCMVFANTQIAGMKLYVMKDADLSQPVIVYGYREGLSTVELDNYGEATIIKKDKPDIYDYELTDLNEVTQYMWDGTMISKTVNGTGNYYLFADYVRDTDYHHYVLVDDMKDYVDNYSVSYYKLRTDADTLEIDRTGIVNIYKVV